MLAAEFILLGVVSGVHGLKGHIIVKSYTDPVDNIIKFTLIDQNKQIYRLTKLKMLVASGKLICCLADCNDRNQAEKLVGTKLYCHQKDLPATKEEEFYFTELKNKIVLNTEREEIGKISAIFNFGAEDLIEITFLPAKKLKKAGKRENNLVKLYPFTQELFPEINKQYVILARENII